MPASPPRLSPPGLVLPGAVGRMLICAFVRGVSGVVVVGDVVRVLLLLLLFVVSQ